MFRYTICLLFALTAAVAFACEVYLHLPLNNPVVFALDIVMPAPLAVMLKTGNPRTKAIALGGLVSYGAWLVLGGLPFAAMMVYRFVSFHGPISWEFDQLVSTLHSGFVGLYLPWVVVTIGGALGFITHNLLKDSN
jgi:hypothetical protein